MQIVVCLPGHARGRLNEAVSEAMAPFEIDEDHCSERCMWDRWYIDNEGGFVPLPGCEDDPRLVHELAPDTGAAEPAFEGRLAGGPRGLLDFSASLAEARELAGEAWDTWHRLAAGLPPAVDLGFLTDIYRRSARPDPYKQASQDYWEQPLLHAFEQAWDSSRTRRYSWRFLWLHDPVRKIGVQTRDAFVQEQTANALDAHNVLTLDGWWYEAGDPGIHAACQSQTDCPHTPEIPADQPHLEAYLAGLPPETLLINVSCHA